MNASSQPYVLLHMVNTRIVQYYLHTFQRDNLYTKLHQRWNMFLIHIDRMSLSHYLSYIGQQDNLYMCWHQQYLSFLQDSSYNLGLQMWKQMFLHYMADKMFVQFLFYDFQESNYYNQYFQRKQLHFPLDNPYIVSNLFCRYMFLQDNYHTLKLHYYSQMIQQDTAYMSHYLLENNILEDNLCM